MGKEKFKPMVSIIVLAYNNLDYTKLCIKSLYEHTSHLNFELITVNNGSADGTEGYFDSLPNPKKINISINCGVAKAFNEGLKLAEGEFVVFLSNDLVLTPNWLENLLTCAQSDERIGMVVPVSNFTSYYQQVNLSYKNHEELNQTAQKYNQSDFRRWEERLRLVNYLSLTRNGLLQKLGGFDEIYSPCIFEDDDLSFRIRRAGYKLILARDTFVHHFGSVSKKRYYESKNLVERNRRIFSARFGVDAWDDTEIDFEIVDLVAYTKTMDVNILGIGSRCAGTVLQIKNRFREKGVSDVRLWGLAEDDKYLADLLTIYEEAACAQTENAAAIFNNREFDCIIIDDVQEIDNPETFFMELKGILKHDGQLVFSIPNELFYVNLIRLLTGHPHSTGDGIAIRYFDLDKLVTLLKKKGYAELQMVFTKCPVPTEHEIYVEALRNLEKLSQFGDTDQTSELFCTKRFIFTAKGIRPIKNILLYPGYDYLRNSRAFDDKSFGNSLGIDTGENFMWVLREELAKQGYDMLTLDNPSDIDDAELILFYDVPKYYGNHCFLGMYQYVCQGEVYFAEFLKRKVQEKTKAKLAAILNEPPCIMPENYEKDTLTHFDLVFTYRDELVDDRKYFKFYTPQPESVKNPYVRPFGEKKLCTFVSANKSSLYEGELYSERRKAILFFQENHDGEFDFYGKSWEGSGFTSYKGAIENKLETLSRYKFAVCYENGSFSGWISEKIFDCFFAGCVPIYLGAPNITDYIPFDTFIDKRDFADYAQLYDFISHMGEGEYNRYLHNIDAFLNSDGYKKFTRQSFAQNIVRAIMSKLLTKSGT